MQTSEYIAIGAILASFLSFLGYSIDPAIIQTGVMGLASFLGLCAAVYTAYKHHQAVKATV